MSGDEIQENASQYVKLNVGGSLHYTTIGTLTKHDTMFRAMFNGSMEVLTDSEGWILIDRCGKHFGTILNFLRDGSVALPESSKQILELLAEAKYYCIADLVDSCDRALVKKDREAEPICRVPLITSQKEEQHPISSTLKMFDFNLSQRTSYTQREIMLAFMKENPELAFNKFQSAGGVKRKMKLLNELTIKLNSCSHGASKSAEKWLKSWQDWRIDTKAKAAKIRKLANETGGGPSLKLKLSNLEEELMHFLGAVAVMRHDVPDPLEATVVPSSSNKKIKFCEPCPTEKLVRSGLESADTSTPLHHRKKRKRPADESSDDLLRLPEEHVRIQKEVLETQKALLETQQAQLCLQQQMFLLQSEQGERMVAAIEKMATTLCEGLSAIMK